MRVAYVLAAWAALWVQPVGAVSIVLTSPNSATGAYQSITLFGLGPTDAITASGNIGELNFNYWNLNGDGSFFLNGNTAAIGGCSTKTACTTNFAIQSGLYPEAMAAASLAIRIRDNIVDVDWSKIATFACFNGEQKPAITYDNACGYSWRGSANIGLEITVTGSSANTFRYDVSNRVAAIPEPRTWALMLLGIGLMGAAFRRHNHMPAVLSVTFSPTPL